MNAHLRMVFADQSHTTFGSLVRNLSAPSLEFLIPGGWWLCRGVLTARTVSRFGGELEGAVPRATSECRPAPSGQHKWPR